MSKRKLCVISSAFYLTVETKKLRNHECSFSMPFKFVPEYMYIREEHKIIGGLLFTPSHVFVNLLSALSLDKAVDFSCQVTPS